MNYGQIIDSVLTFSTFEELGLGKELEEDSSFSSSDCEFNTIFIEVETECSETSLEYCSS